jgi:hypothetical protein
LRLGVEEVHFLDGVGRSDSTALGGHPVLSGVVIVVAGDLCSLTTPPSSPLPFAIDPDLMAPMLPPAIAGESLPAVLS